MIKPIKYLNRNQCPDCEGELKLIETDVLVTDVSKDGIPNYTFTEVTEGGYYDAILQCKKCGNKYRADKVGLHFFIARSTPQIKFDIKEYNPFLV